MLRALVTGVSSGIGAAIALELLESGYQATGLSRRRPDISAVHSEPFGWVQADLGDLASLEVLAKELPVPRVFVHAAGFIQTGAWVNLTHGILSECSQFTSRHRRCCSTNSPRPWNAARGSCSSAAEPWPGCPARANTKPPSRRSQVSHAVGRSSWPTGRSPATWWLRGSPIRR